MILAQEEAFLKGQTRFDQIVAFVRQASAEGRATLQDVIELLVNLGFSRADSRKAAERVIANAVDKSDIPALVQGTLPQFRVTKLSPRPADESDLARLFEDALAGW